MLGGGTYVSRSMASLPGGKTQGWSAEGAICACMWCGVVFETEEEDRLFSLDSSMSVTPTLHDSLRRKTYPLRPHLHDGGRGGRRRRRVQRGADGGAGGGHGGAPAKVVGGRRGGPSGVRSGEQVLLLLLLRVAAGVGWWGVAVVPGGGTGRGHGGAAGARRGMVATPRPFRRGGPRGR